MKRFLSTIVVLLILSILPPLAFASEEDLRTPVVSKCIATDSNLQEMAYCASWQTALKARSSIRPMQQGDQAGILMIVLVKYDEDGKKLAVSTTANFLSPFFAGQTPWLASKIDILPESYSAQDVDPILQTILEGVTAGLPGVMESAKTLMRAQTKQYKSVEGMNEEGYPWYLIDSNDFTCVGSGT